MKNKYTNILKKETEKLIRISYSEENNCISNLSISGDFFIHPEEAITKIEEKLNNVQKDTEVINKLLIMLITQNNYELIGISPESITEAIITARPV